MCFDSCRQDSFLLQATGRAAAAAAKGFMGGRIGLGCLGGISFGVGSTSFAVDSSILIRWWCYLQHWSHEQRLRCYHSY